MTLEEKMVRWKELSAEISTLEAEIKAEVMQKSESYEYANVKATYSKGRGSYNYEGMANEVHAPMETVNLHTKQVIDWKAVVEEVGVPKPIKEKYYTAADSPSVSLKVILG